MALIVEELLDGTTFGKETREYAYTVHGTEDLDAALNEFYPPGTSDYFTVDGVSTRFEAQDPKAEPWGKDCVKVTQTWNKYKRKTSEGSGETLSDSEIAFEFGVETQKVIHARAQEKCTDNTDDHFGLIGATADGVEGIDVPFPTVAFTITKTFTPAEIDDSYLGDIYDLTTKVNNSAWFIFKPYEVRFDGATTSQQYNSATKEMDTRITFKFSARPEEDISDRNISVKNDGSTITATGSKSGWQYMDLQSRLIPEKDESGEVIFKRPVITGVWINTIYEAGDFTKLGLGGVAL